MAASAGRIAAAVRDRFADSPLRVGTRTSPMALHQATGVRAARGRDRRPDDRGVSLMDAVTWVGGGILVDVIVVDAVLETYAALDFTAWPIAELTSDRVLPLSGQMTTAEVACAMAVIFAYADIPTEPISDLHLHLDRHLVEAETLLAPGGLRFRDTTTQAEIVPGCCCGLENWREWGDVLDGKDICLGHDPDTELVYTGETVRLRQEVYARSLPLPLQELEIRLDELPALLASVQLQLEGFLDLAHRWLCDAAPQGADRILTVFDENFQIYRPLELG